MSENVSDRVFYRKFRPDQLSKLVGQSHVTNILKKQCGSGFFHHAYLMSGSSGSGKTTTARILAAIVNCESRDEKEWKICGKCKSCTKIKMGLSLDVHESDSGTKGGKEEVEKLIVSGNYSPAESKMKIFIIDEAHRMSQAAMDALLKPIEEPPPSTMFILCTSEVHKMPDSIASRCMRFNFRQIEDSVIAEYIGKLADHLSIPCDKDACRQIAVISSGNMRTALNYFQSLSTYIEGQMTSENVRQAIGMVGRDVLYQLIGLIAGRKTGAALDVVEEICVTSPDISLLMKSMSEIFRNVMLWAAGAENGYSLSDQEKDMVESLAGELTAQRCATFVKYFSDCEEGMLRNANKKWVLESLVVNLSENT